MKVRLSCRSSVQGDGLVEEGGCELEESGRDLGEDGERRWGGLTDDSLDELHGDPFRSRTRLREFPFLFE